MAGFRLKASIATALCAVSLLSAPASGAREPPAAGCVDLQGLAGGWRTGEREVLLRDRAGNGARLELDARCPPFPQGVDLVTLAAGNWACPGEPIGVRGGDAACPVVRMTPMGKAQVAEALRLREARLDATVDMDRVVVQGRHWRDIRGTTDRCVDARFLRGWKEAPEGLIVEVVPGFHSGHRRYLVETVHKCRGLGGVPTVRLVARSGGVAVCGRPGDKVVLMDDPNPVFRMGPPPTVDLQRSCEIRRVTPLPPG